MSAVAPTAARPLDVRAIVEALDRAGVRYVLTGSLAAAAWGVAIDPAGDFDLAPDLGPENLERLAALERSFPGGR